MSAESHSVVVSGGFDRKDTPTSFAVPQEMGDGPFQLRDDTGKVVPVQLDRSHRAWFILSELKAGQFKSFVLEKQPESVRIEKSVECILKGTALEVSIGGNAVLSYQAEKSALPEKYEPQFQRGGYIFPLYTPGGKLVLDDYPPNHKHHHGIWSPWTKTEFEGRHPDFWNMGDKTGTVEVSAKPDFCSGPVFAGIRASHKFVDLSVTPPKTALNETWDVTVFTLGASDAKYRLFDFVTTQTCASESPLKLPKYHYGGLGVRGNRQWDGAPNAVFLTSENKDRSNGNESRGRWCHMGGKVDGELAGLAIFSHPDNFRAPQPMRIHPTEPFFCFAPSQLGDWEIKPTAPYVARYRFIVADGAPDPAELNRLWQDYENPPQVTVK